MILYFQIINNIQQKMSTLEEVLNRLYKLKDQATAAPDFLSLQKVSAKVDKIRSKVSGHRNNKQLVMIIDKIDLLVKQKNKYFRQKLINNSKKLITEDNMSRNEEADRTLKYSKSAQNLKLVPSKRNTVGPKKTTAADSKSVIQSHDVLELDNISSKTNKDKITSNKFNLNKEEQQQFIQTESFTQISQPQKAQKKGMKMHLAASSMRNLKHYTQEPDQDGDKTQIKQVTRISQVNENSQRRKLMGQIDLLQQKLSFSFKKIDDLNKKVETLQTNKERHSRDRQQHLSPMTQTYLKKHQSIVEQYSQKLRQKTFIIQDTKSKLQYFKSLNEQLKSKLINQQRRHEDYVDGLKIELKNCRKQIEHMKKQNNDFKGQIDDLEQKNQSLLNQIKKLVEKLEEEAKDKENVRKNLTNMAAFKVKELQAKIGQLTSESFNLSKLEIKVQHQVQEKQQLLQFKAKAQFRMQQLEMESKKYQEERDKVELQLFRLQQEVKMLKSQLRLNIEAKQLLADELLESKQKLAQQYRVNNLIQYQGQLKAKNKISKLKQIKGLLTELR